MFLYVCKQTFLISWVRISQNLNSVIMRKLRHIFLCEDEDIDRFSYLHSCTFNFDFLRRTASAITGKACSICWASIKLSFCCACLFLITQHWKWCTWYRYPRQYNYLMGLWNSIGVIHCLHIFFLAIHSTFFLSPW